MKTYQMFICDNCKITFSRESRQLHKKKRKFLFCSKTCNNSFFTEEIEKPCGNCEKLIVRKRAEYNKSKSNKIFCNHSCSASYQNTHKTHGNRRSKLETWLELELIKLYPMLEFHFNQTNTINSELDIYIPSLKLAFELNGIFHYEPIYGSNKLQQIQNNDNRKFQACLERGIELCIIDSSSMKNFKPDKAKKYLDVINNIILIKIDGTWEIEPSSISVNSRTHSP